jgi:hypothetical protein
MSGRVSLALDGQIGADIFHMPRGLQTNKVPSLCVANPSGHISRLGWDSSLTFSQLFPAIPTPQHQCQPSGDLTPWLGSLSTSMSSAWPQPLSQPQSPTGAALPPMSYLSNLCSQINCFYFKKCSPCPTKSQRRCDLAGQGR